MDARTGLDTIGHLIGRPVKLFQQANQRFRWQERRAWDSNPRARSPLLSVFKTRTETALNGVNAR